MKNKIIEQGIVGILIAIIIAMIKCIFPQPRTRWVLVITLITLLVIVLLFFFMNQFVWYLQKVKFYRLFIVCVFPSLFIFLIYGGMHSVLDQKIQKALPIDIGYILAISTFWLIFIKEGLSYKISREVIGLAATCIPFKVEYDKIQTVLIFNPNFNQWMFPGGHVNIEEDDFPEDVAVKKAEEEAGITVELLCPYGTIKEYEHCKPRIAPHFEYLLSIDKQAKCRKIYGHEYHLDFTYVAEIKEIKAKGKFKRVTIDIKTSVDDSKTIRELLSDILKKNFYQNGKVIPKYLFPEDIPDRLFVAFQLYKKIKGIRRAKHENK